MHQNGIPSAIHFHIRWAASGNLDWDRHETRAQAERWAVQLRRRDEKYTIEQFGEECQIIRNNGTCGKAVTFKVC